MLVLSRKKGQSLIIGNDITVTVKEIRGRTVRLSIETPKDVSVFREEIYREISQENRRAAAAVALTDKLPVDPVLALSKGKTIKEDP